jgi:chorismate mutase/prephenate dehydratase
LSLAEYRKQISAVDRELLDAINRRLELVRDLHAHKAEEGIPTRDLDREASLVRALQDANDGPLSSAGVAAFFNTVIELTRREMYGD